MKEKKIKYVGPSKKMAEALEAEGLHIEWPKAIKSNSDLAIEGTFYTGCDWEKIVTIDLRGKIGLDTKAGVNNAIAYELNEAYEAFDINEELNLNLQGTAEEREARGVPDAARLLEDMQEQESCLKRFSEVADAVASGKPVPPEEDTRKVELDGNTAEKVVAILEVCRNHLDATATVDCLNVVTCDSLIKEIKGQLEG